ncbi:hypothetical protein QJS10_CPB11g00053 [Acorus calamus]|uniref:Uncharacterized protein n=1 Tax=Acorus calamus TaxID=4465 RepID=A0AAV9DSL3_ACOCL|nr:hypothetical protein QJS10_CPB11g00053 [Acorus calamus]
MTISISLRLIEIRRRWWRVRSGRRSTSIEAPQNPRRRPPPPLPLRRLRSTSLPNSAKLPQKSSSVGGGGNASFLRSFRVYFPRSSSQVPPRLLEDMVEMLRVVEELCERESHLRTELLEHKILKETIAIVPFLKKEIAFKDKDLVKSSLKIDSLKAESETLRRDIEMLKNKIDDGEARNLKPKEIEAENLKKMVSER